MMSTLDDLPAGIYTRASYDPSTGTIHEGVSVTSQEGDCRGAAGRLGCRVAETYSDNDLSASRYSTKARSDWSRLLADIEAGHLQVVILWESARGSRKLHEWALFLELCREHCPYLHIVSQDETYDVRKPRDWKILAAEGIDSASESDKISSRVRRGQAAARAEGRPAGHPAFGYRRVYDPGSGRMTTQAPIPSEAAAVAELYERIVRGETLTAIALDWNNRADLAEDDPRRVPKTRQGGRWTSRRLRAVALTPVYMGHRYLPGTTELLPGNWEPIVSDDLWRSVHQILESRSRSGAKPGKVKYLLSNIMRCGLCGSFMGVFVANRLNRYVCRGINDDGSPKPKKGCTAIRLSWADDHVEDLMVDVIADPEALAALMSEDSAEGVAARREADNLKGQLARMLESVKARDGVTWEEYTEVKRAWAPDIARLEEKAAGFDREASQAIVAALMDAVDGEDDRRAIARQTWRNAPLGAQRELVKMVFPRLRVMTGVRGRHAFDPKRIRVD